MPKGYIDQQGESTPEKNRLTCIQLSQTSGKWQRPPNCGWPLPFLRIFGNRRYTISSIAQMPQGQMPAQRPQPMQRWSSETYS